jgi:hypothetical protein
MTFWCIEKIGSMTSIVYERTYVKIYTVYFVNSQLMYQSSALEPLPTQPLTGIKT